MNPSVEVCQSVPFNHTSLLASIDGWLKVLKADSRAIFSTASYASHAADWLREREHAITGPNDSDLPAQKTAQNEMSREIAY
jgi:antirestriction protein ArdC